MDRTVLLITWEVGSMKTPEKKKRQLLKSHIPFRLNFLFFTIFMLFVVLILRLGYMQIIHGEDYQAEVDRTESTTIARPSARGEIYDANLRKLVANDARNTITYTRGPSTSVETMANIAYMLAEVIDMPHRTPFDEGDQQDMSERDMKDFYYAHHLEEMQERIDAHLAQQEEVNNLSYEESLALIKPEEIEIFSEQQKEATVIFAKMNAAYALSTVNIKNEEVTDKELATVSEHLHMMPGVGTGTDWVRAYPEGNMLRSVLGTVSDERSGLPQSELEKYLAKGYSRNDRVGMSYLEEQYEEVLHGLKARVEIETNTEGDIINQQVRYPGQKGDNLIMTTDIDFQSEIETITTDVLQKQLGLNESAYIVAMNPQNGDILALAGKRRNSDGEIVDDAMGAINNAFEMGSVVKGATILSGYMDGVLTLDNNVIVDQPLQFSNSRSISSVFNRQGQVAVNDIEALKFSSNTYMAHIAMRMGGKWDYTHQEILSMDEELAINKLRSYYEQFGLGSETGVDLPSESIGQQGALSNSAQPLFLSFGQFDTYTPFQLGQYISTIANKGTRYAPRFISEVRGTNTETGNIGKLKTQIQPKILNQIDVEPEIFDRVHEGYRQVLFGGYGAGDAMFHDAPFTAGGKTGTAEATYWGMHENLRGEPVINQTFTAFAPFENPEIAIAVVLPYVSNSTPHTESAAIGRRVMDAYFATKAKKQEVSEDSNIEELEETATTEVTE